MWANSAIKKTAQSKQPPHHMGENSPNLVTLLSIKQNVFTDG
jgi:hypothetical protein